MHGMKCMHGQHLLTLSNAFFKFTVFELYKKEFDKWSWSSDK
jgi:hypothetical protein